jgi:hypothetical protein
MRSKVVPFGALACALAAWPAYGQEQAPETRVRLHVSAPSGALAGDVVRGGVPLPRDLDVKDPSRLGLWRATSADGLQGEWVPSQWSVLSRHQGLVSDATRPARWALLQFPAHDGGSYWLRTDAPQTTAAPSLATEGAEQIDVDTGRIRFSIPKTKFAPLGGLRTVARDADGKDVERTAVAPDGLDVRITLKEKAADGTVVDRTHLLSQTRVHDVAVEENGPLRTSIRMSGKFCDEKGAPLNYGYLSYTIRIWADKGSDALRVFFTLENNGVYGKSAEPSRTTSKPMWVYISHLELVLPTTMAAGKVRGSTADGSWDLQSGAEGVDFRLLQVHELNDRRDESKNFRYAVTAPGRELATGTRSKGGLQVDDGATAVHADVRHFWQSYPKAMSFDDGRLEVELFPKGKDLKGAGLRWPEDLPEKYGDAYEFEGGRHKTYEVLFSFTPAVGAPAVAQRERTFQDPPAFTVDPWWVKRSGAVGGAFAYAEGAMPNPSLAEARAHHAKLQKAIVDVRFADAQGSDGNLPPASLQEHRETRGHTMGEVVTYDMDMYGYMNFGDMAHDKGYCSGHHDWVRGIFTNWLRHQKREFYDAGVEMLRHRYDIDQYHCTERQDPNWKWFNGFQRFELGFHGARLGEFHPHGEATACPQNTWLEGLLLAYAITGDPRAMDCARENADAFVNYFSVAGKIDKSHVRGHVDYLGALSGMSNGVQQLLAYYEFTGDRKYFDVAAQLYEEGLLLVEEYYGNKGFYEISSSNQREVWPIVRLVRPLIEVHRHTRDPRALSMLLRALTFFQESAYDGGFVDDAGWYMPLQLPYMWEMEGSELVARRWFIPYNYFVADGFAYAYERTKEPQYLLWARRVWRDGVLFFQAPVHQSVPWDYYSAASYSPRQYPHSETKNNAWVLGESYYYLQLEETLAARGDGTPVELPDDPWFTKRRALLPFRAGAQPVAIAPVPGGTPPAAPLAPVVPTAPTREDAPPPAPGSRTAPPVTSSNPPSGTTSSNPPPAKPQGPVPPAGSGAGTGRTDDSPVGQAPSSNPAPRRSDTPTLSKPVEMDDRDAVFAGDWGIDQARDAYVGQMRVNRTGAASASATFTVPIPRPGTYRLYLWWPTVQGAATDAQVEVRHESGWDRFVVNQAKESGRWRLIATVMGSPTQPVIVKFGGRAANGAVVADAIKLEPVPPGPGGR